VRIPAEKGLENFSIGGKGAVITKLCIMIMITIVIILELSDFSIVLVVLLCLSQLVLLTNRDLNANSN